MVEWGPLIQSLGTPGILAAAMFYLFKHLLPRILDQHFKAIERIAGSVEKNTKGLSELTRAQAKLSVLLIQHDATVRGQNPETLGTTEELLERVLNGGGGKGG